MVTNQVPASGHFDASRESWLPTADDIRRGILAGDPSDAPQQLTISNLGLFDPIDLSFEVAYKRVIFRNCSLNGGFLARRATLSGLEFHEVLTPLIDLEWAHIDGDVRLVHVSPPQQRTIRDQDSPLRQPDSPPYTRVRSTGTVIIGEVALPGSRVRLEEADALVGRRQPASISENAGGINWEHFFNAVGLGSALVAWVAVVGGATLWARMESIDAPALPTIAALGQSWMVTAGLRTLLVPMLLGASVALLVYYSRWDPIPTSPTDDATLPVRQWDGEGGLPAESTNGDERSRTRSPRRARPIGAGEPDPAGLGEAIQLRRARPLVALRNLRRSTARVLPLAFGVVGAMLGATLYVAEASWEVLFTTFIVLLAALAFAAVDPPSVPDASSRPPAATRPRQPSAWFFGWLPAAAAVAGILTGVAWFIGGAPPWGSVIAGAVAAIIAGALLVIGQRGGLNSTLFVGGATVVAVIGICLSLYVTVTSGWLLFMAAVTVFSLWVSLGALVGRSHGAAAITVFAAIVVWSGTLQYAREMGDRTPEFPFATVQLSDTRSPVSGLLVGRTSEVVLVADSDEAMEARGTQERHVHVLPAARVKQVDYGADVVIETAAALAADSVADSQEEGWDPRTWDLGSRLAFLVPDEVKDAAGRANSSREEESDDGGGAVTESPSEPDPTPFAAAKAVAFVDAEVNGSEVRLELLGLRRSQGVAYLWMRVLNLGEGSQNVAAMLDLANGQFDTPRLVDPELLLAYQVSATSVSCDCARDLDVIELQGGEGRNIDAQFVIPRTISTVDVVVPAFGTFKAVDVE